MYINEPRYLSAPQFGIIVAFAIARFQGIVEGSLGGNMVETELTFPLATQLVFTLL